MMAVAIHDTGNAAQAEQDEEVGSVGGYLEREIDQAVEEHRGRSGQSAEQHASHHWIATRPIGTQHAV